MDIRLSHLSYKRHIKDVTISVSILRRMLNSMLILTRVILPWILIGIMSAAFVKAYIPGTLLKTYLPPTPLGLLVTLGIATVIEVCSEGSAPIAFEIFRQTGALGNAFAFLMAGVVTDYTEIGTIWRGIGRKVALLLPIISVPQVVLVAHILNTILT